MLDALTLEFLSELGADDEPTPRGIDVDDLIGFVAMYGEGFFDRPET